MNCIECGKQTFLTISMGGAEAAFCLVHLPTRALEVLI